MKYTGQLYGKIGGKYVPLEEYSLPTVQAPVVPSVELIAEGIAMALMGLEWQYLGVLTKRQITQDAEKVRAHILANGYREQSSKSHGRCANCGKPEGLHRDSDDACPRGYDEPNDPYDLGTTWRKS